MHTVYARSAAMEGATGMCGWGRGRTCHDGVAHHPDPPAGGDCRSAPPDELLRIQVETISPSLTKGDGDDDDEIGDCL